MRTPSRAEHGPEGVFVFENEQFRDRGVSWDSKARRLVTMDETRGHGLKSLSKSWLPRRATAVAVVVGLLHAAAYLAGGALGGQAATQVQQAAAKVDKFLPVDCLLPGQIRRLGSQVTYVTRRRAIKTSAGDCEIRGGEYVAFDRANYATALQVWLPEAEGGDPAAQTYVGEIFEKGLGVSPDYAAAAQWYRRAAESGYARAAINLGNLYEQGLGVPQDKTQALNWYRRAAGLPEISFEIAPSTEEVRRLQKEVDELRRKLQAKQGELERAENELETLRRRLEERRSEADSERAALARLRQELETRRGKDQTVTAEVRGLQQSIAEREARLTAKDGEVANLRASLARLEKESGAQQEELARLKKQIARAGPDIRPETIGAYPTGKIGDPRPKAGTSFGRYHALVIGNNEYRLMPPLQTAVNDAKALERILRERYSFKVTLLLNASRYDILSTLNDLRERLTEKDNLLIYYAGHGELDKKNQRGHWLPVDAEPTSSANWISNISITDVLNVMTVRQLLVVADSCFSGTLTRSALGRLEAGISEEERAKLIQRMVQQRSRMVMTSGGVEPVLDSAGGPHSVFAQPFIELLQANVGVLSGQEMFRLLQLRVTAAAQRVHAGQVPEYAPIKYSGHESGDFFFVRTDI